MSILIAPSGYAKLADFGLAKLHEGATSSDTTGAVSETRTQRGMIAGTAAYMSPEQAAGHRLDSRSDIFSFGIVLYEADTCALELDSRREICVSEVRIRVGQDSASRCGRHGISPDCPMS